MKKINNILPHILFIVSGVLLSLSYYLKIKFANMSFEQIWFAITNMEGSSTSHIGDGVITVSIGTIIIYLLLWILILLRKYCRQTILELKLCKKIFKINIFPIKRLFLLALLLLIFSIFSILNQINAFEYIKNQLRNSEFYSRNYVNPKEVKIEFPEEKRNLIYIYLEAMQSDIVSKTNGGYMEKSYIPNLETLALNNINFSQNNNIGGATVLSNTSWTIAGMVAQTAGITFNVPIDGNMYTGLGSFMPGLTSLGDILLEHGYNNYLMVGSDANFGGRKDYFKQHGNYDIFDYYSAIEENKIDDDYYVWWGYEDKKLFEYAKEKILKLSDSNQPFNFTMLTVDTHFYDGYLDDSCSNKFDNRYANVFYCNDSMIIEFINWIKKQDFYENTTIILSGDHYATQLIDLDGNEPRTYNVFINSAVSTEFAKNREFATIDLFPTTLASLGVKIEGERLGLGTNLFSGIPTLIEQYGFDLVNLETSTKSDFYNIMFLGDDYEKLLKKENN